MPLAPLKARERNRASGIIGAAARASAATNAPSTSDAGQQRRDHRRIATSRSSLAAVSP